MNDTVGIVIVSHSRDIAKGTADMVRQMVGSEVRVAFCGGNPDGGLGTNVSLIMEAINDAWSPKGVWVTSAALRPTARWRSRCCSRSDVVLSSYAMRRSSRAQSWRLPKLPAAVHSTRSGPWPRNSLQDSRTRQLINQE
jgi:PTS system fructose IIA component